MLRYSQQYITAVEFDKYSEAKAYVDEHNLVYEEPKFGE